MNSKYPPPLVIFPEDALKAINTAESKFHYWLILQALIRNNNFSEDTAEVVLDYYKSHTITEDFVDLQLQFFLVRNSEHGQKNIRDVISSWISCVKTIFPRYNLKLTFTELLLINRESLKQYGKYYYSFDAYRDYVSTWNNGTVELKTWKRFSLLVMPKDFQFMAPLFEEEGGLKFPVPHMRKLFDEYVDELYIQKFKPRLNSKMLADRDRLILDRVIQNIGSKEDKLYLKNQFLNFYSWRIISENISKALTNEISISELDINSQTHFANYFALIKYYEALIGKPQKEKNIQPALWFKNLSKDNRNEVFELLKNVFDKINKHCPDTQWNEFKSIFTKNGSTTKIVWTGGADLLNYIFRKQQKILSFSGGKWNAVAHYFKRHDINDTSLDADKLAGSSHYDENKDKKLVEHMENLISILS